MVGVFQHIRCLVPREITGPAAMGAIYRLRKQIDKYFSVFGKKIMGCPIMSSRGPHYARDTLRDEAPFDYTSASLSAGARLKIGPRAERCSELAELSRHASNAMKKIVIDVAADIQITISLTTDGINGKKKNARNHGP